MATVTTTARLYVDANEEYHSITHAAQSGLNPGDTEFYMCGLFYFTTLDTTQHLGGKDNGSTSRTWKLQVDNTDAEYRVRIVTSTDGSSANNVAVASALSATTWYFVEWYHNPATDLVGIALDGGAFTTVARSGGLYAGGSQPIYIGQAGNAGATHLNGRLQKLAFFNVIPDATLRAQLRNSGNGLNYHDLSTSQKTNLISWYDGNETSGTLWDAHGSNHMTDNNTVESDAGVTTYTAQDSSDFNEANSEYLSIADASQTGLSPGDIADDYYVCGFIKLDALDSGGTNFILCKGGNGSATGNELTIRYNGTSNLLNLGMYDETGIDHNDHYCFVGTPVPSNFEYTAWIFFEAYLDYSAKTGYISVNRGTEYSDSYIGTGPQAGTKAFTIGTDGDQTAGQFHDGRIANIVWVHGIPIAAERNALYGRGYGVHYTDRPTLSVATYVSWWPLTESSGTRYDVIGSNHLTDNNTVTGANGIVYDIPPTPTGYLNMPLVGVG